MESCTLEWPNKEDIADPIRRARLVMVDAHEVRLASIKCRHQAAVLRKEAERLRTAFGVTSARARWSLGAVKGMERPPLAARGSNRENRPSLSDRID